MYSTEITRGRQITQDEDSDTTQSGRKRWKKSEKATHVMGFAGIYLSRGRAAAVSANTVVSAGMTARGSIGKTQSIMFKKNLLSVLSCGDWVDDVPCWGTNAPCWVVPEVDCVGVWVPTCGKRFASHANWSAEKGGGCSVAGGSPVVRVDRRIRMVKGFALVDLRKRRAIRVEVVMRMRRDMTCFVKYG